VLAEDGIVASWPPTTGLPLVQADWQGLMQVFLNLVRNSEQALRSSARRELRIGAAQEAGRVVVRFADSGPGVRRPEQLFRPFAAQDGQPAMGLFVSRAIARSFGGDLLHEDSGEGACFAVTLRSVPAAEEAVYA
jgi:C4-dicarboxylate-specific signal transduction histidine kinase